MTDYQRIANAIRMIREQRLQQPSLEQIAEQVGLSPFQCQRLFKRYAGVSPKRFLQHLTSAHARKLLQQSRPLLDTSFAVGLSGPGRLHDLLINSVAATPGEVQSGGRELRIAYGFHPTPFGRCLLAATARGICRLEFIDDENSREPLERLKQQWPAAQIAEDEALTAPLSTQIFNPDRGGKQSEKPLTLLLKGTNFQLQLWQALLQIPSGCLTSYAELARRSGHPGASRAVGSAIGNNPIGWLIPCHRVLRSDGGLGGYRWGEERKLVMLGCELSRSPLAGERAE